MKKKAGFGLVAIMLAAPMTGYYEGMVPHTYKDPVGIPTACYGETDAEVVRLDKFKSEDCLALLGASLTVHAIEVSPCITRTIKAHEAAAVISWSYNVGSGAACGSTLVRKINAGHPASEWCAELKRWTKAGGVELRGLVKRRESEYKMCTTGRWQ